MIDAGLSRLYDLWITAAAIIPPVYSITVYNFLTTFPLALVPMPVPLSSLVDLRNSGYLLGIHATGVKVLNKMTLVELAQHPSSYIFPTGYTPLESQLQPRQVYRDPALADVFWYAVQLKDPGTGFVNNYTKIIKISLRACGVDNCNDCNTVADKLTMCSLCAPSFFLLAGPPNTCDVCLKSKVRHLGNTCLASALQVPAGYTVADKGTFFETVMCPLNCDTCTMGTTKPLCTVCKPGFFLDNGLCSSSSPIGSSAGVPGVSGLLDSDTPVASTSVGGGTVLEAPADALDISKFVSSDALAQQYPATDQPLTVVQAVFEVASAKATVVFSEPLTRPFALDSLSMYVKDDYSDKVFFFTPQSCPVEYHATGFAITLQLPIEIMRGTLFLQLPAGVAPPLNSSAGAKVFTRYPVTVPNVQCSKPGSASAVTKAAAESTSASMSSVRSAANVVVSAAGNPASSMALDKILSELFFVRLVDGPMLVYPHLVLYYASSTSTLPVSAGNPLEDWAADPTCAVARALAENEVACNLLDSYGEDLVIIAGTLGVCLVVTALFCTVCRKKKAALNSVHPADGSEGKPEQPEKIASTEQKQSLGQRILWNIGFLYGVRFFFSKMESVSMEVMIYSLVTLTSSGTNSPLVVGKAVALGLLLYYLGLFGIQTVIALKQPKDLSLFMSETNKTYAQTQKSHCCSQRNQNK